MLELVDAEIQGIFSKTLKITIKNTGSQDIDAATDFIATLAGEKLDKITAESFTAGRLVGGRQLGKSTLLKEIGRRCETDARIDCRYIVLTGTDAIPHLAMALGLPPDAGFADVRARLRDTRRRRLKHC